MCIRDRCVCVPLLAGYLLAVVIRNNLRRLNNTQLLLLLLVNHALVAGRASPNVEQAIKHY